MENKEAPEILDGACAHPTVVLYVTHGRFAPVQRYWSCQECGASFAPSPLVNAPQSADAAKGEVESFLLYWLRAGWSSVELVGGEVVRKIDYDALLSRNSKLEKALEQIAKLSHYTLLDPEERDDKIYGEGATAAYGNAAMMAQGALAKDSK